MYTIFCLYLKPRFKITCMCVCICNNSSYCQKEDHEMKYCQRRVRQGGNGMHVCCAVLLCKSNKCHLRHSTMPVCRISCWLLKTPHLSIHLLSTTFICNSVLPTDDLGRGYRLSCQSIQAREYVGYIVSTYVALTKVKDMRLRGIRNSLNLPAKYRSPPIGNELAIGCVNAKVQGQEKMFSAHVHKDDHLPWIMEPCDYS